VQQELHLLNLEKQDAIEQIEKNEKDNNFLLEEARKLEEEHEALMQNAVIFFILIFKIKILGNY